MSDNQSSNKRIAKNTVTLSIRMIFLMLISLYTSRVILAALGISDYGIYNVVGGFVAMFGLISNSLSSSVSRFLTFELGTGDKVKLKKTFCSAVTIQITMALGILLLLEIIGVWYLNNRMTIDPERLQAANWVFQFSALVFCINIISVPYNASIIAHEKMSAFAYISILEAILKLGVCYLIQISRFDRLITYSFLLMLVAIMLRLIYGIYCKRHFEECTYRFYFDKVLFKKMFAFSGWNMIGATAGLLRTQGVNLLLNAFFGTFVNAARGVSLQVCSVVTNFAQNFIAAVNPQITKRYASGEFESCFELVISSSRFAIFLIYLLSLPILLETPTILGLWLVEVPEFSVIFIRLIFIYSMTESVSNTLITLMLATGNIRNYQIIVGGCQLLNLPFAYILLKIGMPPYITYYVSICIAFVCMFLRLVMLNRMVGFPIARFLKDAYCKILFVILCGSIIPVMVTYLFEEGSIRLLLTCFASLTSATISIFFVGCKREERIFVLTKVKSYLRNNGRR